MSTEGRSTNAIHDLILAKITELGRSRCEALHSCGAVAHVIISEGMDSLARHGLTLSDIVESTGLAQAQVSSALFALFDEDKLTAHDLTEPMRHVKWWPKKMDFGQTVSR